MSNFDECLCDACAKMRTVNGGTFIPYMGRARFICDGCTDAETNREAAKRQTEPLPF